MPVRPASPTPEGPRGEPSQAALQDVPSRAAPPGGPWRPAVRLVGRPAHPVHLFHAEQTSWRLPRSRKHQHKETLQGEGRAEACP
jgi:hypothetical protein